MSSPTTYLFEIPTKIVYGLGSVAGLPDEVRTRGTKPLIVTDPGLVKAGVTERVTDLLDRAGFRFSMYDEVEPNPTMANVHDSAALFNMGGCDCLIGLGGGSAMDTAKMAGTIVANGGHIRDYGFGQPIPNAIPPLICVPTTCGTGSEVTYNALFNDHEKRRKTPLYGRTIAAAVGILDADLLRSCPTGVIASTGMDALTHAIESYTNTNAHPLTDALAIYAIEMIGANLRAAVSGRDPPALHNQLVAATIAAIPLNLCGVGLVHAMSNPFSGHFNLAHGIVNSVLLPIVMEYNWIGCEEKYARIARALGANIEGMSVHEAARAGVQAVRDLFHDLPLPRTLGELGAKADRIPAMVDDTFLSRNIPINPRRPTGEDVAELFRRAIGE